jgi:hypothetical protein
MRQGKLCYYFGLSVLMKIINPHTVVSCGLKSVSDMRSQTIDPI